MADGKEIASAALGFISERWRGIVIFSLLALTLALPFLMRSEDFVPDSQIDGEVVIITPHNEAIRAEFSRAFAAHMKEKTGKNVRIDWRTPSGTTDVIKMINKKFDGVRKSLSVKELTAAEIANEFHYWKNFVPPSVEEIRALPTEERERLLKEIAFMKSEDGIGIDLFFGGGAYPFEKQAEKDQLVAGDADKGIGIAAIAAKHPDWFSDDVIPESAGGEPYIDPDQRWVGTCLSAFGIMFNRDVLERLQIEKEPTSWEDLAHPYFFKQIALADPTKSGSANKAFEMLIQEQMHKALARLGKESPELGMMERENLAVREGWKKGLQLILKIGANARYFTESSEKIPADIASGNAAAGMCIDFYGRSYVQRLEELNPGVNPRVGYITPAGGSSVGADPIGMFRGAPNPELATAFMEFVISPEGQGIWGFRAGVPGGPKRNTLHRMPIRKDIYQGEEVALLSDPNVRPYEYSENFEYRSDWTGRVFTSIRFIIRAMCIDSHEELRMAWKEVHSRGFPEKATEVLLDFDVVNYDSVMGSMRKVINSDDWERKARLAKELRDLFKSNYKKAIEQARKRNKTP